MARTAEPPKVEIRTASVRLVFTHDETRHRIPLKVDGSFLKPTAPNISHARRVAKEIGKRLAEGTFDIGEFFPDETKTGTVLTLRQTARDWLASKGQLEAGTIAHYESGIRKWEGILGHDALMPDLTFQVLSKAIGQEEWPSPKTANNYLVTLRGIMEFHYAGPNAGQNPMIGIKNLRWVKPVPDPLSAAERDRILVHVAETYPKVVWAYFQFAFFTGMRPEEIIALQWGDIDWNKKTARVQRVRTFKGSERAGSKTHSIRDVFLMPQALEALVTMKPFTFMKGADIFENPVTMKPWNSEKSQREYYWNPTLRKLGIRSRRAYTTRHTYATVGLIGGVNPAYMAQQMGHSSTKMFFETYARWIETDEKSIQRDAITRAFGSDNLEEGVGT